MKRETLNKLREYIDLVAAQAQVSFCAPSSFWSGSRAVSEKAWQEFARAAEAEAGEVEELSDETIILHHAVMDSME